MAFPLDPLPLFVDIAPGASPADSPEKWEPYWVNITSDVRVGQGISIEEGIPDEAGQADPSSCSMTLDNRSGHYSPRNPLGQWYGALAKNTPLRVRIERGRDTFARTVSNGWGTSDSGIVWSGTGSAALSVSGGRGAITTNGTGVVATNAGGWNFDMTGGMAIDQLPGAGGVAVMIVNFRRLAVSDQFRFRMDVNSDNTMTLYFIRTVGGGSTTLAAVSTPTVGTVLANTRYNFRLRAEGGSLAAKVWLASGTEPDWLMTLENENTFTYDNSLLGTAIQLQKTASGTPTTTTGYWYDITINSYPFVGTVMEWPVRWDQSGNDSTVPLKANGILRRLQQGNSPLRSPLYSYLDGYSPLGLWMMEDESGATLAASQTTGAAPATVYESSPAGWNGVPLDGTVSTFTVGTSTTISGTLPRMSPASAWSFLFAFYMPVLPVTNPLIFRVRSSGTVTEWNVRASDDFGGVIYLVGYLPDGTIVVNQSYSYTPGGWNLAQVEIQQSGANVTGRIVKYDVRTGEYGGATSASFAGSVGSPKAWSVYGSTGFQESAIGPVVFYSGASPVVGGALLEAARGFAGETAGERVARLAAERGVSLDLVGGGKSSVMGPQRPDTFLGLLAECVETDLGLLLESRGGLRYRTRGSRYAQISRMILDMSAGHVARPPEPTDDDQRLRNDVTVSRVNGGSARAYDSVSIAHNGLYDTSVSVNTSDDAVLPSHASFRLYLGTWDELRWPSITVNVGKFASSPNFLEYISSLDPGAYINLTNLPDNLPVGNPRLLIEHIKTTLDPYEWMVELTCGAYMPWRIPRIGMLSDSMRVNLKGSTLAFPKAAVPVGTVESWVVSNSGRDWSTTAVPYDWMVGGETVEVTAITGSGSQTATVVRGTSGITKAHDAGEVISMAHPLYLAL